MPSPSFPLLFTPIPLTPEISREGDLLISSVADSNQWYYNDSLLQGERSRFLFAFDTGYYWSQVSVNGCMSDTSLHYYVDIITGKTDLSADEFAVYPIPNDGRFTIQAGKSNSEKIDLIVYNSMGIQVYRKNGLEIKHGNSISVDFRPAPQGIYTLFLQHNEYRLIRKILVNKY